ncbi:glycosidase [Sphingomonas asaccharolytica]|uniref:glycoside hydrolase family 130 protein n=1 Tax=Sphingomonas asaccharolytica TaxID=40681 RepID=UPI0008300FC1|nr:glycosidase [Sphingomonas asaccharolytica]
MTPMFDQIIFDPRDVDLSKGPLAGHIDAETYCLGAFNPGLTRLPNGNLLMMVRIAEALRTPIVDQKIHSIRWVPSDGTAADAGRYCLDPWPLEMVDTADPRKFMMRGGGWKVMALTSLSWLLPVELDAEGRSVVDVHYRQAIAPRASYQCYGVEDARISRMDNRWLMTTCSVSPERHSTTLYSSNDARDWLLEGIVLDHQNKDMLIFEDQIGANYWAQTRPLGDLYFAYPPGSEWRAGPSINLATSPDALHWKPHEKPGIRPHAATLATARMGGGTPPVLTDRGWLSLWHGVEPYGVVGIYRTYWSLLDARDPSVTIATSDTPLLQPAPHLTDPIKDLMYLDNVVFTTGIADAGDHFVIASGEADLACRITHVPKSVFGL